jgi:hypothetical protein
MTSEPKYAQKLSIITTKRDDLFSIGRVIAESLDSAFLTEPAKPVLIAINGCFQSGKSIIAEAGREALIGKTEMSGGKKDDHEQWIAQRQDGFGTIEIGYSDGYHNSDKKFDELSRQRKHGGISYLQNTLELNKSDKHEVDIEVWIESPGRYPISGESRADCSPLAGIYNQQSNRKSQWTRYIEIVIHNPKIAASKKFQGSLEKIRELHLRPVSKILAERDAKLAVTIRRLEEKRDRMKKFSLLNALTKK